MINPDKNQENLDLGKTNSDNPMLDMEDFIQYSQSIYYKYSNIRGGLFWSKRVKDVLEFSPEEIKENSFLWNNSIHPEDRPLVQQAIEDYNKGKYYNIEYRIKTKSGKWIWLHDHFIHKTVIGEEIIISGNAIDITQRKEAEIALKESEERFRNYINSTSDIVFTLDTEQRHIGIFGDWAEKAGIPKSYFLGKTTQELLGENAEIHVQANAKALKGEHIVYEWSSELEGSTAYYQTSLSPLYKDNQIIGLIGVGRNITELKNTEIALRKSEEIFHKQNIELRKLNSDKNRFISILAHDLKNPFSNINGLLNLIIDNFEKYEKSELEKLILMTQQSVNKYSNLLEDILQWSKTQSGNFTFNPEKFLFEDICKEVIENLETMANHKNIQIEIKKTIDNNIYTDKHMLATILRNLISNSIKFTHPSGKIDIFFQKNSEDFTVTVSDNGIGIEPERTKRLFEISNIHSTVGTKNETGSGLGLLLCKELIEKQNGKIWVESELGRGSKFHFLLPI